jgi:Zn-dependent protease
LLFRHTELIGTDAALFLTLLAAVIVALIVGIGFHEFCHAYSADNIGDTLPRRQGRVTLNPIRHLDPFGTLMIFFVGFGWGKPVQFNPYGTRMSVKQATLVVSLAGPMSNFVAAALLAIPIRLDLVPYVNPLWSSSFLQFTVQDPVDYLGLFLTGAVYLNIILGVFNLLPIHPLDGFKVAVGVLPDDLAYEFSKLAQYGPLILIALIAAPFLIGYSPLADIMFPAVSWLVRLFTGYG